MPDVTVRSEGTLFVLYLHSEAAQQWTRDHVEIADHMWLGDSAFVCEHWYAKDIAFAMLEAGLKVV